MDEHEDSVNEYVELVEECYYPGQDVPEGFGVRDTARNTNFRFRTDSLNPLKLLMMRELMEAVTTGLSTAEHLLTRITILFGIWSRHISDGANLLAASVKALSLKIYKIFIIVIAYVASYICEFSELLYYYLPDRALSRFPEPKNRTISCFNCDKCRYFFRFHKDELRTLLIRWQVPDIFECGYRHIISGEAAMLIFLHRLMHGDNFETMQLVFGGDGVRRYGGIIHVFTEHLFQKFYNKISGNSMAIYKDHIDSFRAAIWRKVVTTRIYDAVNNTVTYLEILFEHFRICGFLDDTRKCYCRVGTEPTRLWDFVHDIQRAFYT